MKRIILCSYLIIILMIAIVDVSFASPKTSLQNENQNSKNLQMVLDNIDNQNYKTAMNMLDQINDLDQYLIKYNKNKFNELLQEYKNILIEEANAFAHKNEYSFALNLLNSKLKYYQNDSSILKLISFNKNQIKNKDLVEYNGPIEHLFTHCLLAYPNKAFSPKNQLSKYYDADCITPYEFKKILNSLYNNNYILIDINSIFEIQNNITKPKKLFLPPGKKPLIFSFDDVNYDSKKQNCGMVDKIILDRNNNIATYTSKQSIAKRVSYDNEFITIMENFIKKNPDFSFNGAKGIINLTGYDGILGYRTQKNNANSKYEIKKAKEVVNKLKKLGWKFACHSYGHYHMKTISDKKFKEEIQLWQSEVEPLIGKTNMYVYPYGEWDIYNNEKKISNKQQMLIDAGFKIFFGVGSKNYYGYIPINSQQKHTLLMDRKAIDGNSLRTHKKEYAHLFNCEKVYDNINRTTPYNS